MVLPRRAAWSKKHVRKMMKSRLMAGQLLDVSCCSSTANGAAFGRLPAAASFLAGFPGPQAAHWA
jgi:hypothetical protein